MQKPKISAKTMVADINAGLSESELMEKYHISEKGLHTAYGKLIGAGMLKHERFQDEGEDVSIVMPWGMVKCPSCHKDISSTEVECQYCGIIIAKFREKQIKEETERVLKQAEKEEKEKTTELIPEEKTASTWTWPLGPNSVKSGICRFLITWGILMAGYFFFFYETTVYVPAIGGYVNNLGLMAQQQNGILFGLGISFVGGILEYLSRSKDSSGESSSEEVNNTAN